MERVEQNVADREFDTIETEDDAASTEMFSAVDEAEKRSSSSVPSVGNRSSHENSIHPDFDGRQRGRDGCQEMDLMCRIKDMYRLLDLISEQGSGGLGKSCYLGLVACVHCSLP